jgi:hypothetical protein
MPIKKKKEALIAIAGINSGPNKIFPTFQKKKKWKGMKYASLDPIKKKKNTTG